MVNIIKNRESITKLGSNCITIFTSCNCERYSCDMIERGDMVLPRLIFVDVYFFWALELNSTARVASFL